MAANKLFAKLGANSDLDAALPPLGGGRIVSIGDLTMQSARVRHTGESYALRIALEDRPGLTYSGDVSHWEDLAAIVQPGDTLLCEAAGGAAQWREGERADKAGKRAAAKERKRAREGGGEGEGGGAGANEAE